MNIEEFVSESLKQIAVGINKANTDLQGKVENRHSDDGVFFELPVRDSDAIQFELSVVVENVNSTSLEAGGKAGGKAKIAVLAAEVNGEGAVKNTKDSTNQRISKITFKVEVNNPGMVGA